MLPSTTVPHGSLTLVEGKACSNPPQTALYFSPPRLVLYMTQHTTHSMVIDLGHWDH